MEITFGYQKNLIICSNSEYLKRAWSSSLNKEKVLIPDLEVLPYDNFSPHPEVSSRRLIALRDLLRRDSITAFSTIPALFQPFFDKASINTLYFEFKESQKIDRNELISNLVENGYDSSDLVIKPSSYALRGSVIDIFPSNSKFPVRLDLDDDLISSISIFDSDTQKTMRRINSFIVRPSRGFVLNTNSIKVFKKNWRSRFKNDGEVFESVIKGKFISGIEFYSSLFYDEKPSLKDYINDFNIFRVGDVVSESQNYWDLISSRYEEFLGDNNRPILKPGEIFNSLDEINKLIAESEKINLPDRSYTKPLDPVFKEPSSSPEKLERDFDSFLNFRKDELVVHANHGIGKFLGLKNLNNTECFLIEYQNNELLYVPVNSISQITPYIGVKDIPLDSLSKKKWSEKSQRSKLKAFDIASEILEAEAKRNLEESQVVSLDVIEYEKFCDTFKFTETPDQERVIKEVIADLLSEKPQDRLICGEVGFGKTEVALRASFIVVQNNYQVCILAPTTVLAKQHFEVFKDRFSEFPHRVCLLTREQTKTEKTEIYKKIKENYFSIVIGTHALFNKDISFKNLNLLIIDEEHKFGVRQKDQIRSLKSGINVISLSATPIPRTLNLSLSKVRDISLITTPPTGRKSVKTIVSRYSKSLVFEAIQREFYRDGQVFYLLNNVSMLEQKKKEISERFPDKTIAFAHGQLRPKELSAVMQSFINKEIDLLVCTTIIESGIDIENANTLIVEESENYGLSQLHQIRGRVGRSQREAFAYFLLNEAKELKNKALERIEALQENESLLSGFSLAMRDLEIRGAGELLGEKQSGPIDVVGLTLFSKMIESAIKILKGEKIIDQSDIDIDIGNYGFIPEDIIPQAELRLSIYKEISSIKENKKLEQHKKDFIDRFGNLTSEITNLYELSKLKNISRKLSILSIKYRDENFSLKLADNSRLIPPSSEIRDIKVSAKDIKSDRLTFIMSKLESFLDKNEI
tara:strand:- start:151 stop:3084 length:2934 start_codon:yes stop_codon:yes gene_type:complete